jgi:hypothetical protein
MVLTADSLFVPHCIGCSTRSHLSCCFVPSLPLSLCANFRIIMVDPAGGWTRARYRAASFLCKPHSTQYLSKAYGSRDKICIWKSPAGACTRVLPRLWNPMEMCFCASISVAVPRPIRAPISFACGTLNKMVGEFSITYLLAHDPYKGGGISFTFMT